MGDSVTDDILGPKALNIKTVWVDRDNKGGDFGQDYRVKDLEGILEVLK